MASASISKLKDAISSLRNSNARSRLKKKGEQLQHTVIGGVAGFAMGRVERNATAPLPTVLGLDHKLLYGVIAHSIAVGTSGKFSDVASGAGDGLISSYGYAEGRKGTPGGGGESAGDDFESV